MAGGTKNIGLNIPFAYNENLKDIQAKIELLNANTKSVTANVIRTGKTLRDVQTKIWWDSGKTIRKVRAWIGEPATTKHITAKVGFPATTRKVGLKTPLGYRETWRRVRLKAEKYSEIVTRIVVADTRQTAYSYVTKPVGLNIGKYPYNAKTVTTKVEQYGKSIRVVRCNILLAKGQSIKSVGCKVNKSRLLINVRCNVTPPPPGQTLKTVKTNIWSDLGETVRPVGLFVRRYGEAHKPVKLSVWSDLGETVRPVGLFVGRYGEAHKPVKLSVWSDLGETVKTIVASVVTYPETYKAVRANVSPTHRWIPVSANIVRSGMNYRPVKANIINEVWSYSWRGIATKIQKYASHTKNVRARRKVQTSIKYYEGYHIRPVSVNVNVPTANTRAVKLKIHMFKVYGTITDENGNPVKDATVFLYKRGSGEFITAKTTKTNHEGYYEIPEVPYGKYYVLAIKLAHDLVFSPIVMNGKHIDIEKNMPCYTVSKDVCVEEILSPIGDVFRFQVIYDETFDDGTRVIEILLIWGDLYGNLPTRYRDTDGIFMVETPEVARLTVVHDFWETGGSREEGKDDHFLKPVLHELPSNKCYCKNCRCVIEKEPGTEEIPCSELRCPYCGNYSLSDTYYTYEPTTEYPSDVTWFTWKASLYRPNFIGFIVRCVTRADVYTILSLNIGGYYDIPSTPPSEPVPPGERLPPGGGGTPGIGGGGRGSGNINVIASPQPEPGVNVPRTPCIEGTHEVFEYCPDGITEKRWRDCIGGKWVEGSLVCCEGEHEVLEYCPDGITEKRWRDCIGGKWVEGSQECPPECEEGTHEVLEYCPDGITEKRWRDCIGGKWVYGSQVCPIERITRPVRTNVYVPPTCFRQVRCTVKRRITCRPTIYLPPPSRPGIYKYPNIMGYILSRPQWSQNVKTVTVSIGSPGSTAKQITAKIGLPATSRTVRCTVNYYVTAATRAIRTNIAEHIAASNTKRVSCKLPLFERGYSSRTIRMNILKVSKYPVPVSGELLVIDVETGYLLYVCKIGNDGFYSFSVPPNKCYYLIINKYGYRSRMEEICIGDITLVDRNTKEYGGDIFDCEMNCYYYIRGFEFPPLEPSVMSKIYGHVYDARTLKPIRFALVSVDDGLFAVSSDENGYYEVFVDAGTHKVRCSRGRRYKPVEATVVMKSDVEQDFYLTPIALRRVVFTGGLIHKPIYM